MPTFRCKRKSKKYPIPIRNWSEDDRPREKLLKYGEHTLSNAEFLAILRRTGTPGRSPVDIGRELLRKFKSLRSESILNSRIPKEPRESSSDPSFIQTKRGKGRNLVI